MIPKIIHYCWLSSDPIPENLKWYMQTWKKYLPDYEFLLWNFDRFNKNTSLWVKQTFDNKKYAFAADFIRLYAVYNHGGIYLDMDIEVLKSFNDLLNSDLMMAYENKEKTGIEAGCFGASRQHPLIQKCLSYYEGRSFIKADGSFDMLPLPKIIKKYIGNDIEQRLFSEDAFTCKSFETGEITPTAFSYAIHHFAGSWTTSAQKKYNQRRYLLIKYFGRKFGKILSYIPFCIWQVADYGVYYVIMKILKKCYIKTNIYGKSDD